MALKALFTSFLLASTALAKPLASSPAVAARSSSSTWWAANIDRHGDAPYADYGYQVYRNVVDFGADPTGATDSTAAINEAISNGTRCGYGCDSTTTTPAFVYFPPGTYLVSTPIVQYYYTQLVGDAIDPPTLKAAASFTGMAVIDADPYTSAGANWYVNQNNFYRQVRNFIIDLTAMPETAGAGIHWQVAQATSLQNIEFNMIASSASKQLGIFMDNGSGGFMSDLTFNGGQYGAFFGSQQFTSRNMTFNNCQTAIYMNWNWGWTLSGVTINDCDIGLDLSTTASTQVVGSIAFFDSVINDTPIGIKTSFTTDPESAPVTGGTLFVDNVEFSGTPIAIANVDGDELVAGDTTINAWGQGNLYTSSSSTGSRVQETLTQASKSSSLLASDGSWFTRSKPQYTDVSASSFVSIKATYGAVGNGATDDTAAFKAALAGVSTSEILFIDYGVYLISDTITLPANIKIVGEHWANILCTGSNFADMSAPIPCIQVGTAGESGAVEIQDLIIGTQGPAPGAILMEWNLASSQGASGMWDVHMRVGGFTGSDMQSDTCLYSTTAGIVPDTSCIGSFLLFQATSSSAGIYLENNWMWVADHELDLSGHSDISIYNGRGMLIQSAGPTWIWGSAVEHNTLYNYQVSGATDVFMGFIQSETPYFQGNPVATTPFSPLTAWKDPKFAGCKSNGRCIKAWALRILGSSNVYVYGTGFYSWFIDYDEACVTTGNCQRNMIAVQGGSADVYMYTVTTIASVHMINYDGKPVVIAADNLDVYGDTILSWTI